MTYSRKGGKADKQIRVVGIVLKPRPEAGRILVELIRWLEERGIKVLMDAESAKPYSLRVAKAPRHTLPFRTDVIVVLGGDGTLLAVARSLKGSGTPILAVNLGSLGFLTAVRLDELYPALTGVLQGRLVFDERCMIDSVVKRNGRVIARHTALNDVVINKGALARIIQFEAFSAKQFIGKFLADGLIVATPTGSTAYSLSAGGPILYPSLHCLALTPICPHTLTNRPLVVPLDTPVRILLTEGDEVMLTVDGQIGMPLDLDDEVIVARSPNTVKLIQPENKNYFEVLRQKLKWGER